MTSPTSIHEAGHAVILLALGRPFARVTTKAVQFSPGQADNDLAMVHLAGVAAEVIAGGDGAEAWRRAPTDAGEARRLAPTDGAMRAAWAWTCQTLRRHWPAVNALAAALDRQGVVDYDEARAMFEAGREYGAED